MDLNLYPGRDRRGDDGCPHLRPLCLNVYLFDDRLWQDVFPAQYGAVIVSLPSNPDSEMIVMLNDRPIIQCLSSTLQVAHDFVDKFLLLFLP